jgi:hypothetical protein
MGIGMFLLTQLQKQTMAATELLVAYPYLQWQMEMQLIEV